MNGVPGTNRPKWDAEETHPEQAAKLRVALEEVVDPEIGLNIIQLGLIRNLKIDDEGAIVRMILTTPFCPYGPAMIEVTHQKAQEALGIPTAIDLGMDMWDFSMMEEGLGADWGLY
jgi:metal-sulfur cluster biosynthetic enzyme